VLSVLNTALWAFHLTEDFREGVVLAANLSGNPTTSGAVFGALAGAYYGVQNIPQDWRRAILQSETLIDLAERLVQRA
jgi:ADP-ribosyl-[dinitrogen reductase] hydrolase